MAEVKISEPGRGPSGHELSDLSPRNISIFGVGLTVLVILALLAGYAMMSWLRASAARRAEPPSALVFVPDPVAGPKLETRTGRALAAMRAQEESRLRSYGWIDQEKGIVHIPIERAMEILVERGLPARQSEPNRAGDRGARRMDSNPREPRP